MTDRKHLKSRVRARMARRASAAIRAEVDDCWPLDDAATIALKRALADRIDDIATAESAALAALAAAVDDGRTAA